jgi:endonuclease I
MKMNNYKKIYLLFILFLFSFTLYGCVDINVSDTDASTSNPVDSSEPVATSPTETSEPENTEPIETTDPDYTDSPNYLYYQAAYGKTGEDLKQTLNDIIDDHKHLSYSQVWDALKQTDEDPNNPDNVILFYSGISRSKSLNGGDGGDWNREHIWPKSHGDFGTSAGAGTDIHHLRATDVSINGKRGNLNYDYTSGIYSSCTILVCNVDSDSWEPDDSIKGDVARMIFYMAVRYENDSDDSYDRVDLELNDTVNNGTQRGSTAYFGKVSVLLEWHELDPVDEAEMNRNNLVQEIQGNRNPFIDHPEWAELIW